MKTGEPSDLERPAVGPDTASDLETAAPVASADDELTAANRNIRNGLLWCGGGILFTFLTYYMASQSGGRYFVATGAVLWGAVQALRGFFDRAALLCRRGDRDGMLRTVGAALGSIGCIAVLGLTSYKLAHANDVVYLAEEQVYENEAPHLRFVVPAGFSPMERVDEPETDEVYARSRMTCYDGSTAVGLELCGMDPEAGITTVDEVLDELRKQDDTFFDAGLLREPDLVELGGKRMLRRIGRRTDTPDLVTLTYDLVHDDAVVTVYFYYEGSTVDASKVRRGDALAASLELL